MAKSRKERRYAKPQTSAATNFLVGGPEQSPVYEQPGNQITGKHKEYGAGEAAVDTIIDSGGNSSDLAAVQEHRDSVQKELNIDVRAVEAARRRVADALNEQDVDPKK